MAEGTSTYMGVGLGKYGNYELQGTSESEDVFTITGASSTTTGDLFVVQNSTGTEFLVITSSGAITLAGSYSATISAPLAVSGSLAATAGIKTTLSSTLSTAPLIIANTSTGALAAGAVLANGITIQNAATGVLNTALLYDSTGGTAVALLGVNSSASTTHPTAFLVIGGSAGYSSGAGNLSGGIGVGMFTKSSSYYLTSALATTMPLGLLKVLAGSKVFYLPLLTDTMIAAA